MIRWERNVEGLGKGELVFRVAGYHLTARGNRESYPSDSAAN